MVYLWILAISCFLGGIGTVVIFQEEKRERKEEAMRERNEVNKKKPYYIPPERMMELRHYCRQYRELKDKYELIDSTVKSITDNMPKHPTVVDPVYHAAREREKIAKRIQPFEDAIYDLVELIESKYGATDTDLVKAIVDMLATHVCTGEGYETQVAKIGYSPVSKAEYFKYYHWFFYFLDGHRN
jgi:hypothetical protein